MANSPAHTRFSFNYPVPTSDASGTKGTLFSLQTNPAFILGAHFLPHKFFISTSSPSSAALSLRGAEVLRFRTQTFISPTVASSLQMFDSHNYRTAVIACTFQSRKDRNAGVMVLFPPLLEITQARHLFHREARSNNKAEDVWRVFEMLLNTHRCHQLWKHLWSLHLTT